jgi:Tol biopolymer transport system component
VGAEELLYADGLDKFPTSFSPDGKLLLYNTFGDPKTRSDLMVLPLSGDQQAKPFPFRNTSFADGQGKFSPNDGAWIAYASDESRQPEVYVAPFPGPGGKKQISTAGGTEPIWRPDGKEIFYIAADNMLMAAEVTPKGAALDVGVVRPLFGPIPAANGSRYDVSADGKSFLVRTVPLQTSAEPLTVIENWAAGLRK